MPFAVTHFIITIIILTILRDLLNKKTYFPAHYIFIGGLAGLLPDVDKIFLVLSYFTNISYIDFTHNLIFPSLFLVLSFLSFRLKSFEFRNAKLHWNKIFFVIFLGIMIHLILDIFTPDGIIPFFPFSKFVINFPIYQVFPISLEWAFFPIIDAILLIFWISYLEYKHKISSLF